jgi:hypothetical protein
MPLRSNQDSQELVHVSDGSHHSQEAQAIVIIAKKIKLYVLEIIAIYTNKIAIRRYVGMYVVVILQNTP